MPTRRSPHLPACALAALLLAGCAVRYGTLPLGQYDLFAPYADLTGGGRAVELARAGYIAVLDIVPHDPGYRMPRDHLTFRPVFPRTSHDSTHFSAGTHRLRYEAVSLPMVTLCGDLDVPTISGCREVRTGASETVTGTVPPSTHYLVVVAERYVDPYTLAYYLNEAVKLSEDFATGLFRRDVEAVEEPLSLAIANMPGLAAWSGYYVVREN